MSSKPKSKTYVVHHRGKSLYRGYSVLGTYLVGARNIKEAILFLRKVVGKHSKIVVYREEKKQLIEYKHIIKTTQNTHKLNHIIYKAMFP